MCVCVCDGVISAELFSFPAGWQNPTRNCLMKGTSIRMRHVDPNVNICVLAALEVAGGL